MSGQPTPPVLVEPFAKNATTCDPSAPVPGGRTFPFPTPSQVGIVNGAASLDDGFTAANMTDPAAGGIPPFGVDMNGILFYLSSICAYLAAGQLTPFDSGLATAMTGYALGALAGDGGSLWVNVLDGNTDAPGTLNWRNLTNPDTNTYGPTQGAGTYNDLQVGPAGSCTDLLLYFLNLTGDINITGFQGSFGFPTAGAGVAVIGQRYTITNVSPHSITFLPQTGSAAGNQIYCITGGITILPGQTQEFVYRADAGNTTFYWVAV